MNLSRVVVVAVFCVVLSASPAVAKPVYKCEENGKITYTDQPCSPGARSAELPGVIVAAPPGRSQQDLARAHDARLEQARAARDRDDAEWLKQHANRQDRDARVRRAILAHKVIKGMTFAEVEQALGKPQEIQDGDSYGTAKATWIYAAGGSRRVVNFKDGQVTSTSARGKGKRR
jgi:hypothetical protein